MKIRNNIDHFVVSVLEILKAFSVKRKSDGSLLSYRRFF